MTCTPRFSSWLASHFERFVMLKRASGASYVSQVRVLAVLDRYVNTEVSSISFSQADLARYVRRLDRLSPRGRDNVICVVWQSLTFARLHGADIEPLPPRPRAAPAYHRQREPRYVAPSELTRLLKATSLLTPVASLRGFTCYTLLALLVTTGLRISEALQLCLEDIDSDLNLLVVKAGKFGKPRVLPIRPTTVAALHQYVQDPRRRVSREPAQPLFVSLRHRRIAYPTVNDAFQKVCTLCDLSGLRIHDLRHTFAIGRVARWYAEGRTDIDVYLPALSAYLGHVSVENTRCYLEANAILLNVACQRFEDTKRSLTGGQS